MAVSLMKYLLRSTRGTCGKRRVIKLSNVRQPSPAFSFPPEKLIPRFLPAKPISRLICGQEPRANDRCHDGIVGSSWMSMKFYQSCE